ncbi:GntR family transcriptional regulator [Kocuria palustris]|uniref:GntR family transcriptional regulator n=1 Tax=Kocuria palustris TaxID=71999 RepID=UPI00119D6E71|nr:GntR family transcriptional regulator [Kocuria palustris]
MALNKLQPSVLVADQVFDAIHDGIMSGDLPAGHRLLIRDLAAELGTSVMPVREAIRRLEEAGLAEKSPYKGAVVKGLTRDDLLQIYDVRLVLEAQAARAGAERIADQSVELMRRLHREMLEALEEQRVADMLDRDEELLAVLFSAAGNEVLLEMIRMLWRRCRPYKLVGARRTLDEGGADLLSRYQDQLIDAAARRDADAAARISDESLLSAAQRIRAALPGPVAGS